MANNSKGQRLGNYLCKVGYFDIRQKLANNKMEVLVYHGKNQVAGPFRSKDAAITRAEELMSEGYKFRKFK